MFVVLEGALAFFTYPEHDKSAVTCHVLHNLPMPTTFSSTQSGNKEAKAPSDRAIIVEKGQWHAMTAAPTSLGWPGHAIIFETSGHLFDTSKPTKTLAPFAPIVGDGLNGDPNYFVDILKHCPAYTKS